MADYWKSQGRKFCDFCKCWIADNKPSIDFHEGGKKHKDNVSKRLKEIHKNSAKQAKQNKKMEDDIRKMESAAMAAYLKDVENNTRDMTADRIIEEKRNRSDTPSGNRATTIPGTTSGVKGKTQQFLHEIDPCDPTLSRTSRQYQQQPRVPAKPENKAQGKSKANKGKGKGRKAQEEDRSAKPVRKLWYEARSPEGYTYYWHIETNETAWDPPEEGYMTFAEQEEEAREQALQEELLEQLKQEEEIANKEILEEKRANAERERSRQLRKSRSESNRLDETTDTASATRDGQETREEKREEEQRPYRRDYSGSCQKSHPYGAWQTVRVVETKPVDLQLPRLPQKTTAPVAAFDKAEPPPPQRTFKEKTVTRVDTGDSDGDHEPTAFKKRKIGNKNKNMAWHCSGTTNQEMITKLKDAGILTTNKAEAAMLAVDRAKYCHEPDPYLDRPRRIGYNVTISAPHMHAYALSILSDQLFEGAKALDIGSGSGYLTACMAFMVGPRGRVIGVDHIPELIEISSKNVQEDCSHFIKEGRVKFVGHCQCA